MTDFDIKDDLEGRSLRQQIEILLISGPTYGDVDRVAQITGAPRDLVARENARLNGTDGR